MPKIGRKYEGASVAKRLVEARIIRLMQSATNVHLLLKPLQEYMYYEGGVISGAEDDDQLLINLVKEYVSSGAIPPKFIACKELLNIYLKRSGPEGKVIVWSNFIHNINSLSYYLTNQGIGNEVLYGATPVETEHDQDSMKTREQIISRFHDEQSPYKVIIANPYAVGESISLHRACRNAVYLDRNYNATPFIQSKDRIHRYGLDEDAKVNYHYLVSKNSIDLAIHNALLFKEERMQMLIEDEEIPLFKVYKSEEEEFNADIAELIRMYNAK